MKFLIMQLYPSSFYFHYITVCRNTWQTRNKIIHYSVHFWVPRVGHLKFADVPIQILPAWLHNSSVTDSYQVFYGDVTMLWALCCYCCLNLSNWYHYFDNKLKSVKRGSIPNFTKKKNGELVPKTLTSVTESGYRHVYITC